MVTVTPVPFLNWITVIMVCYSKCHILELIEDQKGEPLLAAGLFIGWTPFLLPANRDKTLAGIKIINKNHQMMMAAVYHYFITKHCKVILQTYHICSFTECKQHQHNSFLNVKWQIRKQHLKRCWCSTERCMLSSRIVMQQCTLHSGNTVTMLHPKIQI